MAGIEAIEPQFLPLMRWRRENLQKTDGDGGPQNRWWWSNSLLSHTRDCQELRELRVPELRELRVPKLRHLTNAWELSQNPWKFPKVELL
jgi:hypothetical protein